MVPYLHDLGITDCYTSPFLMAHPGSMHGYDVTDHTRFNPEIGSEEQFTAFARELKQRGMGLVVDVVPNHMCITHSFEPMVVGRTGKWAPVRITPAISILTGTLPSPSWPTKSCCPFADQFGLVLESQSIRVLFDGGGFVAGFVGYSTFLLLRVRGTPVVGTHSHETKRRLAIRTATCRNWKILSRRSPIFHCARRPN